MQVPFPPGWDGTKDVGALHRALHTQFPTFQFLQIADGLFLTFANPIPAVATVTAFLGSHTPTPIPPSQHDLDLAAARAAIDTFVATTTMPNAAAALAAIKKVLDW